MFKEILLTTAIGNFWKSEENVLFDAGVKGFKRVAVKQGFTYDILYFLFSKLFHCMEKCV